VVFDRRFAGHANYPLGLTWPVPGLNALWTTTGERRSTGRERPGHRAGHDIPSAINSPGYRQGHGLSSGLTVQMEGVLTCLWQPGPSLPDGDPLALIRSRLMRGLARILSY